VRPEQEQERAASEWDSSAPQLLSERAGQQRAHSRLQQRAAEAADLVLLQTCPCPSFLRLLWPHLRLLHPTATCFTQTLLVGGTQYLLQPTASVISNRQLGGQQQAPGRARQQKWSEGNEQESSEVEGEGCGWGWGWGEERAYSRERSWHSWHSWHNCCRRHQATWAASYICPPACCRYHCRATPQLEQTRAELSTGAAAAVCARQGEVRVGVLPAEEPAVQHVQPHDRPYRPYSRTSASFACT